MNKAILPLALLAIAVPASAHAAAVVLTATLTGANETAGGDPDGSGAFKVEVDTDSGDFCYTLSGSAIAKPTMAHVHTGAAGADGPPIATLEVTGADSDACIAMEPDLLKKVLADPAGYYINIHTADFPKGALRGQLVKP